MNNIIILGSGRSGTSMLTGMLANSGFHLGDDFEYLKKNKANPKGFYEDYEVNTVNEDILKETLGSIPEFIRKQLFPSSTFYRARWLARLSITKNIISSQKIDNRIASLINKERFCYKDPRLSYTLPIWQSVIEKNDIRVKYLVVYREPAKTANSIIRECRENKALHPLKMDIQKALKVWELMYSHILKNYNEDENKNNWLFIHFNQLFTSETQNKIEDFIGASINKEFPEKKLSRATESTDKVSSKTSLIYTQLNKFSLYT
ncbi:sulfotransferase domain-containing protein [Xanthomarina gelatinilytica]|uniref:sulfotransferase domain-containing protein n=1 Tax=Xanthomarina gelatinilytica TaxID=1137281 RepID=UPI003AA9D3B5